MDAYEFNLLTQYRLPGQSAPKPIIRRISYNLSGSAEYIAYAVRGSATSAAAWTIENLNYDGSGNYTHSLYSPVNSIWDNRASLSYT